MINSSVLQAKKSKFVVNSVHTILYKKIDWMTLKFDGFHAQLLSYCSDNHFNKKDGRIAQKMPKVKPKSSVKQLPSDSQPCWSMEPTKQEKAVQDTFTQTSAWALLNHSLVCHWSLILKLEKDCNCFGSIVEALSHFSKMSKNTKISFSIKLKQSIDHGVVLFYI